MELLDDISEEVAESGEEDKRLFKAYQPTFSEYSGVKLMEHPGAICEAASLSYVELPQIQPYVNLDNEIFVQGKISALQFEAIAYAISTFGIYLADGSRAGFLCGDGPGVGKTMIIAGLLVHCYNELNSKALWLTASADLFEDIEKEIKKLDYTIKCEYFSTKKDFTECEADVLLCTYKSFCKYTGKITAFLGVREFEGLLILDECHYAKNHKKTDIGKAVVTLQTLYPKSRVFYSSATMASATSHLGYMVRLGLWGRGTTFKDSDSFLATIPTSGVSAIELVAVDLKRKGVYMSRQISFENVTYSVKNVELTEKFRDLYDGCVLLWRRMMRYADSLTAAKNESKKKVEEMSHEEKVEEKLRESYRSTMFSTLWAANQRFFLCLLNSSKVDEVIKIVKCELTKNKSIVIGLQSTGEASLDEVRKSTHNLEDFSVAREQLERQLKNYFKYTTEELKSIQECASSEDSSSEDSSSDESACSGSGRDGSNDSSGSKSDSSSSADDESSEDENYCRQTRKNSGPPPPKKQKLFDDKKHIIHNSKELAKFKADLRPLLQRFLRRLPCNTLDLLVNELGGRSEVAEMTGRVVAVEYNPRFQMYIANRRRHGSTDNTNVLERHKFMFADDDGKFKRIAVISDVASTGISLHAAKDCDNKFPRVHITLELPWSPEKAIQQFGRTNRTNQVSPPEYITIRSPVPGEQRIVTAVVQRMAMMGAITKGDHNATDNAFSADDCFDATYGNKALKLLGELIRKDKLNVLFEEDYGSSNDSSSAPTATRIRSILLEGMVIDKKGKYVGACTNNYEKFLNRVLGMELEKQVLIMNIFMRAVHHTIKADKDDNLYDSGIRDYKFIQDGKIREDAGSISWPFPLPGNPNRILVIHTITTDRGRKWGTVNWHVNPNGKGTPEATCYITKGQKNTAIVLFVPEEKKHYNTVGTLYSPSFNKIGNVDDSKLKIQFDKLTNYTRCMYLWRKQYDDMDLKHTNVIRLMGGTFVKCIHEFLNGSCPDESCTSHARIRQHHILTGSVFEIWKALQVLEKPLLSMRLQMRDGSTLVGVKLSPHNVEKVKDLAKMYQCRPNSSANSGNESSSDNE